MKKITKYCSSLFVCALLLSQTSCDSFLDRQEDEALTLDKVWETRADEQLGRSETKHFYRLQEMRVCLFISSTLQIFVQEFISKN